MLRKYGLKGSGCYRNTFKPAPLVPQKGGPPMTLGIIFFNLQFLVFFNFFILNTY